MKITDIKTQVKAKGRYSIFVDGKFAFGLSELGLINSGLRVGQEIDGAEMTALKADAQIDKAYNMVLGLIARRPRSRWEVDIYLKHKHYPLQAIESILNTLTYKGFLNDVDFAHRWVESRRLLKPISTRKLVLELKQKHVDENIIKEVLEEEQVDEFEVLLAEIEKKRRITRYQDNTKLMQYLARQGYRYDDIKRALASDS